MLKPFLSILSNSCREPNERRKLQTIQTIEKYPGKHLFSLGKIPDCWKQADIIPLHKKGPKNNCKNYRPVSLTSILCKVLEKTARQHLVEFWISKNIFISDQFGFMMGRSSLSQLLTVFHDLAQNRNGTSTDVVFMVFSKAFDSVPHERLLSKLQAYGIRHPLLSWVRSFLTNRYQHVVLRDIIHPGQVYFLVYHREWY